MYSNFAFGRMLWLADKLDYRHANRSQVARSGVHLLHQLTRYDCLGLSSLRETF